MNAPAHAPSLAHHAIRIAAVAALFAGQALAQCGFSVTPGQGLPGTPGNAYTVTAFDPDGSGPLPVALVVGGDFAFQGSCLAIEDPQTRLWSPLGAIAGSVRKLVVMPSGHLVAGGSFQNAGGVPASNVARFDGVAWHALGSGINGVVNDMVVMGGDLVVAGAFSLAGGQQAYAVARHDGTNWHPVGFGSPVPLRSLCLSPDGVLFSGDAAIKVAVIARVHSFDGTDWNQVALLQGPAGRTEVMAMTFAGGSLVLGGEFERVNSVNAYRLCRQVGSTFVPIGNYSGSRVYSLGPLPSGGVAIGADTLLRYTGFSLDYVPAPAGRVYGQYLAPSGQLVVVGANFIPSTVVSMGRVVSQCPALTTSHGAGCSSSAGPVNLTAASLPWLGSTFHADATGLAPQSLALGVFGSATVSVQLSSLHPAGVAGCRLLAGVDSAQLLPVQGGSARLSLPLPNLPILAGTQLQAQVLTIEPGFVRLVGSNGLRLLAGTF